MIMRIQNSIYVRLIVVSPLLVLLFISCSAVNQVRTVGKGNTGMELTLGGPMMTNLGAPLPIPNFFAGVRYGLRQDLDIAGLFNITGPIIPGIFDVITGIYWVPLQPGLRTQSGTPHKGLGLGGSFMVQWITDFQHGLVIYPAIECAGGWRYKWINPFIGISLGLDFYRTNGKTPITQVNPFFGTEFMIKERSSIGLKCTFYEVAYNFYGSQVEWVYLVNRSQEKKKYGVLGISLGYSYKFGRSKKKSK